MQVNSVGNVSSLVPMKSSKIDQVEKVPDLEDLPNDSFEFSKQDGKVLTKEKKQEITKKAITTASGWAIFGGSLSTLYFGLRSDKTVAKKYDLDVDQDKKFIRDLKKKQMLWTLPGWIPVVDVVSWLYNKNQNPEDVDID